MTFPVTRGGVLFSRHLVDGAPGLASEISQSPEEGTPEMGTKRFTRRHRKATIVTMAALFEDQTPEELVIPEDLSTLSDEELSGLLAQAREAFDTAFGDGTGLTDDEYQALAGLTTGIEALQAETDTRAEAASERDANAAALAARVRGEETPAAEAEEETPAAETPAADAEAETPAAEQEEALVAAGARGETRISLSSVRSRAARQPAREEARDENAEPTIADFMVASGEGLGFAVNSGLSFTDAGEALNTRLKTHNAKSYESANRAGRHIREQHPLLQINRPIADDLQVRSNDPEHVREIFERAGDESRLEAGSLVAAGGWCAPSTVLYDLIEGGESRDGLLDLPEVGAPRGGISFTTGPDFATLFAAIQSGDIGFSFTEEQDVEGEYAPGANPGDPNVVGPKPCYKVECPPFEEYRLDVDGICITAGMLASRGYPEVLADTIRKVLIGHDHYMNSKQIAQMVAGSTAVTLPATQAGTAAPVLTAIELQVESYRYARRLSRTTTLEAVFPYWIRGAIRSDLSRRLGVENFLEVTDEQIDRWFRLRGIRPQFVYNWQPISGTAGTVTQWPTTVSFLLYSAGTWIRGVNDIITVETLYDSVLLGNNDFTALFTEEGWFVAKRGQDSRVITTSITADGVVAMAQDIAHNGTLVPAA
ncbi:major capsid hexamer protein [Microbacterium phage FuzzBuster]|uniref:Major capsid protein n=1 Tax=Microbacterium phage FuzzBuster TaxID=2590935 RepID=A0A516KV11_9CAUD|nr:major capsid hexamer protein [Microbacterium phage FuzzBuster]